MLPGIRMAAATGLALLAALLPARGEAEGPCPFQPWRSYQGTQLYRAPDGGAYLYATDRAAVDADGAPTAYHPDDVGKPCGATGKGLDCPANAGYPGSDWWPDVLARDPAAPARAFVQPDGEAAGYFVSKTSLTDPGVATQTDPRRYLDARTVPYVVFPGPFYRLKGTGKLGDLGIALHRGSGRTTAFVVADVGPPDAPLGEASIAFYRALGGSAPNPRTGAGTPQGEIVFVLFPYSVERRARRWPMTADAMEAAARALLREHGGDALFESCPPAR